MEGMRTWQRDQKKAMEGTEEGKDCVLIVFSFISPRNNTAILPVVKARGREKLGLLTSKLCPPEMLLLSPNRYLETAHQKTS